VTYMMVVSAGGKWTTYRLMAEETVDKCIKVCKLKAGKSVTKGLQLEGSHDWTPTLFIRLIQDFGLDHKVTLVDVYRCCVYAYLTKLCIRTWQPSSSCRPKCCLIPCL